MIRLLRSGASAHGDVVTRHTLEERRRPLRLLLAEDNPVHQRLATVLLQKAGHHVVLAEDGEQAVAKLEEDDDFDAVLMDVQMPNMDGLEATAQIRRREQQASTGKPGIPILAMTAHAMEGDRERCLNAGMDDYITKPLKKEELFEGLVFCNRTLGFVNAPALMQHIVKTLQSVTVDVGAYQAKRDCLYGSLAEMGYSAVKPQGAFYMFPRSPIEDDVEFAGELQKHNVLVVPGRGFGMPGYFRISYCVEDRTLEGALPGFRAAIDRYS